MKSRTIQPRSMQELLASAEGQADSPWSAKPGFRGPMPQPGEGHPHATNQGLVDRHAFVDELSRWRQSLGWRQDPRDGQIGWRSQPERAPQVGGGGGGALAGALLVPGTCDTKNNPVPAWGGPPRFPPCKPCGDDQEQRYSPGTGLRCCPPGRARPHCPCPEGTWPDPLWWPTLKKSYPSLSDAKKAADKELDELGGVPCVPVPSCSCPAGQSCKFKTQKWAFSKKLGTWEAVGFGGGYEGNGDPMTVEEIANSYNSASQLWFAADPSYPQGECS